MPYTEIQERKRKKYYYRVKSMRKGKKVSKERVYLGVNLSERKLSESEKKADNHLDALKTFLSMGELNFLKKVKKEYSEQPRENFESRYESFCSKFTYNSNAIEGNTYTHEKNRSNHQAVQA